MDSFWRPGVLHWRMRDGIAITLNEADRQRLFALVADRNTPQKHVWRARIVLMSADGVGTHAIMAETGTAKTTVWRWLNAVEGFFAILTRRRQQSGVFRSVVDLQAAINRLIAEHNKTQKSFIWRADPEAINAARNRGFQALESIH